MSNDEVMFATNKGFRAFMEKHGLREWKVYAMLDAEGNYLYVGQSERLHTRLHHWYMHEMWVRREVQQIETESYGTLAEAEKRERELIRKHQPKYNVQHMAETQ